MLDFRGDNRKYNKASFKMNNSNTYFLNIFFWLFFLINTLHFSCTNKGAKTTNSRPNILFIMSDDHTSQAWGIYGGVLKDVVKNKHIKRLAKEGIVLDNVFCTNSICTPSRATILTGQYSHQNGVYTLSEALDPDSMNIAKTLQKNGYETAIIGKWHLKKQPTGFDYFNVLPGQGRYHNPILIHSNQKLIYEIYLPFTANAIFFKCSQPIYAVYQSKRQTDFRHSKSKNCFH